MITGDDTFVQHTQTALSLIETQAPGLWEQVYVYIDSIESVTAGSGIDVATETFRVGDQTAYAPGWPLDDQVIWYASTIVHDSCHSYRFDTGLDPGGRDAELACLQDQLAALQAIGHVAFEGYVTGLIEGVDDPANQYWNDPNRHW